MSDTWSTTQGVGSSRWYSTEEAAVALADALRDVRSLDRQSGRYYYSIPPSFRDDQQKAAATVRDAVRFLCSPDAD